MISLLTGSVAVRRPDHTVLDVNGVGYRLAVSSETLRQVPAVGQTTTFTLTVRNDGPSRSRNTSCGRAAACVSCSPRR